jgi:hypothetical protein
LVIRLALARSGDELFFDKSEHETVLLAVGAQRYLASAATRTCYAARRS